MKKYTESWVIMSNKIKISEIFSKSKSEEELELNFNQFLDDFYNADEEHERKEIIEEEPTLKESIDNKFYCLVAATVHELCHRFKLEEPRWIHKEEYMTKKPLFFGLSENIPDIEKIYMMLESPVCFIYRDIFVHKEFLVRF